ncbi:MAG: hypothetical protein ACQESC_01040 [Nanobdellota archaeon]
MVVKVTFQTSYYLQSKIICVPYNREKLNAFLEKLKNLFFKHKSYLLKAIETETGVRWPIKKIDVWLFHGWQPSTSTPLLLNTYGEQLNFCFFNLVHELIHQNIMYIPIKNNLGEWDYIELEAIVNTVLIRVLKKIFSKDDLEELSFHAEFGGFYKYVWIRTREINTLIKRKNISFSKWFGETYG